MSHPPQGPTGPTVPEPTPEAWSEVTAPPRPLTPPHPGTVIACLLAGFLAPIPAVIIGIKTGGDAGVALGWLIFLGQLLMVAIVALSRRTTAGNIALQIGTWLIGTLIAVAGGFALIAWAFSRGGGIG